MSKVSFRARALDATKPMPVFKAEDIPDLPDFATINRSVPQMPTGMEKEEETEHHLQRALSAQQVYGTSDVLVIPIPEVDVVTERSDDLYSDGFKQPKQYIHIQAFSVDQDIPDYDMDSEDEGWLNEQVKKIEITPVQFEEMMDRLEKGSGQQVVTLQEAKLLLKKDDDIIMAVYDYWLNKRLRIQQPLLPTVKTEKRDGSTTNNPYVAFRRRTEKMQTRKNRKNDEVSYEKMLKLQRDLKKAVSLLEFIKRREKMKKEMLQLTIEVLEKRYVSEDFEGKMLAEAESQRYTRPVFVPPFIQKDWAQDINGVGMAPARKKREYRKRKHKQANQMSNRSSVIQSSQFGDVDILHPDIYSSDDDISPALSPSDHEDDNHPDGPFVFRRKRDCSYHAPLSETRVPDWPFLGTNSAGLCDKKHRFSLTTVPTKFRRRCVGYARRRIGRGGRVVIDRISSDWDEVLNRIDVGDHSPSDPFSDHITYIREKRIPHFRPKTPPPDEEMDGLESTSFTTKDSSSEFNFESFQCHKEQLLQMQRDQQEQLLRQEASNLDNSINLEHSFSSQPTSVFTLDSNRAMFAVSAVVNKSQLNSLSNGATSTVTTLVTSAVTSKITLTSSSSNSLSTASLVSCSSSSSSTSTLSSSASQGLSLSVLQQASPVSTPAITSLLTPTVTHSLLNGPILENTAGLSTSPAATVLQLNFPLGLTSHTPSTVSHSSSPVNISSIITSGVNNVYINKNIVTSSNSSLLKLANQLPPNALVGIAKSNHDEAKAINPLPMDVT